MLLDHARNYPSHWATVLSIAEKIGCSPPTLHEWVKKAAFNSGKRAGVPTEIADKVNALAREVRELQQANELLRKTSDYFPQGGARPPVQAMIAFIDDHRNASPRHPPHHSSDV